MDARYDPEADALYLRLRDGDVARSVEIDDYRVVDLDENGDALGLEVLYPSAIAIAPIAREFGFSELMGEIDEAVADALGQTGPPTSLPLTTASVSLGSLQADADWMVVATQVLGQ